MTDSIDDMLHVFVEEATELLEEAELALLKLDGNLEDVDEEEREQCVGELFRGFHTIKGSAGLFDITAIVEFTHVVESVLSRVRSHDIGLDDNLLAVFLESRDKLSTLVEKVRYGEEESKEHKNETKTLVNKLEEYLTEQHQSNEGVALQECSNEQSNEDRTENENWHISLRFQKAALQHGMDPYAFIKYLGNLGKLIRVEVVDDALPTIKNLDAEICYIGFEVSLKSDAEKQDIESVFEFIDEECQVTILPPRSLIADYLQMIDQLPECDMRLGEMLISCGVLTEKELARALRNQGEKIDEVTCSGSKAPLPVIGDVLLQEKMVGNDVLEKAAKKQEQNRNKIDNNKSSVRVNAFKLEQLIDLVGELVISGANAELRSRHMGDNNLIETMENMSRLVEEIRDTALGLRMVPIGDTFSRFKRVVREASKDIGKKIELKVSGEETELDKTLVEKIGDPLTHLLRNAVDHGIETAEVRLENGKDAQGTVWLNAFHDSGNIVIRVRDNGAGLNKEKILDKAISKGLVTEGENLNDSQIFRLIFEPGFSTADKITNLSGRGVGMDVVRKNIEALRGHVDVQSKAGQGTTFDIRLPLTLAIIDGFQVSVGKSHYIIPLSVVEECIELEYHESLESHDSHYINLRGKILPYIRLRDFFQLGGEAQGRENIVVVSYAGRRAGLVVDDLHGEHQTVIKPLGVIFQNLSSISGATILGNGEIALIADIQNLIKMLISAAREEVDLATVSNVQVNREPVSIN